MSFTLTPQNKGITEDSRAVIYDYKNKEFYQFIKIKTGEQFILKDENIVKNPYIFKYKFQIKKDDKWADATHYISFDTSFNFEDELEKFLSKKKSTRQDLDLEKLVNHLINTPVIPFNLKATVYRITRNILQAANPQHHNLKSFLNELNKHHTRLDLMWKNLLFYFNQILEFKDKSHKLELNRIHFNLLHDEINRNNEFRTFITEQTEKAKKTDLQFAKVIAGNLNSLLGKREEAAIEFKKAKDYEIDFALELGLDQGMYTYKKNINLFDFKNSIEFLSKSSQKKSEIVMLISLDLKFFKRYVLQLFYSIQALKNHHFHFHIIGDLDEVKSVIEYGAELFEKMLSFQEIKKTVIRPTFSTEICPEFVSDVKTFYACSRFINANYFMEYFDSNIYIMDADFFIQEDISPYLNKLKNFDIALAFSSGMSIFFPWRRVMGGSVYLKNTDSAKHFVKTVRSYILANIHLPNSWMLDQNALEFAYEDLLENSGNINLGNIAELKRPMRQIPLARLIEKD